MVFNQPASGLTFLSENIRKQRLVAVGVSHVRSLLASLDRVLGLHSLHSFHFVYILLFPAVSKLSVRKLRIDELLHLKSPHLHSLAPHSIPDSHC